MSDRYKVFSTYRRMSHSAALRRAVANALRTTAQQIDGLVSESGTVVGTLSKDLIAVPRVLRISVDIVNADEYNVEVAVAEEWSS